MKATVAKEFKAPRFHPAILLATANLQPLATVGEVRSTIRRSRTFVMERIAEGDFVAVQGKRGVKGSTLLIASDSVRAWLQKSLVTND